MLHLQSTGLVGIVCWSLLLTLTDETRSGYHTSAQACHSGSLCFAATCCCQLPLSLKCHLEPGSDMAESIQLLWQAAELNDVLVRT